MLYYTGISFGTSYYCYRMILFKNKIDLKIIILCALGESKKKNLHRFIKKDRFKN